MIAKLLGGEKMTKSAIKIHSGAQRSGEARVPYDGEVEEASLHQSWEVREQFGGNIPVQRLQWQFIKESIS